MRFQITLTVDYEVNPQSYPEGSSPEDMLDIDVANYESDPTSLLLLCENENFVVTGRICRE